MNVTLGGDRVGSGKKMQAHLHNYFRSTHNLSEKFASSAASGILYPCLCKLGMRGDSFDISIDADARTIPAKGALFGSYKMQVDVYQCPVRLYQGILHNNPLAIGLNMKQVKFPLIHITNSIEGLHDLEGGGMSKSSLCHYMGFSGIGKQPTSIESATSVMRQINALPFLSYYDIFKTYYANKQEDNAYVIAPTNIRFEQAIKRIDVGGANDYGQSYIYEDFVQDKVYNFKTVMVLYLNNERNYSYNDLGDGIELCFYSGTDSDLYSLSYLKATTPACVSFTVDTFENSKDGTNTAITIFLNPTALETVLNFLPTQVSVRSDLTTFKSISDIALTPFALSNIDDMRYDLLSNNRLGETFLIAQGEQGEYLPYSTLTEVDFNKYALNGLVLKTYQNDIFNNWLNTDWIEGENGINELSKVAVTDGAFSMDALNFAQKLYNMLNRVAVAGATYEDWQDVVYEEVKRRQIESPIFCGGISQEIMFDEIVQTAPAGGEPLGTLGGRGRLIPHTKKGGKIHIKCDEACFIIAIVSLTPRIFYTQGNEFYLTDILTMDDMHKPGLDGIGFQDLIGERLAWWDTTVGDSGVVTHRSKIGKLPAWIEYMTSYDRAHGDFAEEYGKGYMILNRNYERDEETRGIKDATTYIDPAKYNYAFAYSALDAQNFWIEIAFNIKARRLMSARLIPNV